MGKCIVSCFFTHSVHKKMFHWHFKQEVARALRHVDCNFQQWVVLAASAVVSIKQVTVWHMFGTSKLCQVNVGITQLLIWTTSFHLLYNRQQAGHFKINILYRVSITLPSVLWRSWLGSRESIWPIKHLSDEVLACLSGVRCKWLAYGPPDATATPSSLLQ